MFISCQDFVENRKISGNYYLISVDILTDRCICYKDDDGGFRGITNNCIVAVGYDDNFIIAKQHPVTASYEINSSITNYYIIPLNKPVIKYYEEKNVIGPLSEKDFELKKKELGVSDSIKFHE